MSSTLTYSGVTMPASNCIDGIITYTNCGDPCAFAAMCHTNIGIGQYIVVAVTNYAVHKAIVYNRYDAHQDRINNAKVIYSSDFAGLSVIYQTTTGSTALTTYTFNFPTYVRIQVPLDDNCFLAMAEIELYTSGNVKIPTTG
jgi:hypothetical protein